MPNELSRRLFLSGLSAGAVAGLSACGQEKIERVVPAETATATTSSATASGSDPRKWVHFGDSITASGFLNQELENLTGYQHFNAGISGDTALMGAMRAGVEEITATLDSSDFDSDGKILVRDFSPGNPAAPTGWDYNAEINGVYGFLRTEQDAEDTYFYKVEGDFNTPLESSTRILIDPRHEVFWLTEGIANQYSLIIGLGRNDIATPESTQETVVESIKKIYDSNSAENARKLVWEIPIWTIDKPDSPSLQKQQDWNSALADTFGDDFVRPVTWMIENPEIAFQEARVEMTEQDKEDLDNGFIPQTFRFDEFGHFSIEGARAWAYFMFQEMKKRGW